MSSIPGSGRSPGEGNATHSSVLAWRIPWTEEPGGLQSTGSQRVGQDWAATHLHLAKGLQFQLLIPCCPLLLLPSIFPSIRVLSNELALQIRWPKYWSFSFSISPYMNIQGWFPLGFIGLISLQSKGLSRVFSSTTVQKHQFFGAQPSLSSNSHIHTWLLEKP